MKEEKYNMNKLPIRKEKRCRDIMKLKLKLISDVKKLILLIQQSSGNIMLHLPNNMYYNLKNNGIAVQLLKQEVANGHGAEIYLSDQKDYFDFVYFIMGDCL